AEQMLAEGADLLDVGGESTRPGAAPVEPGEELARVLPVLRLLKERLPAAVSVDTRRAVVARAALGEGAEIVNDVSALADPAMGEAVAEAEAGVVLVHMRGTPRTMQRDPRYADVAGEVADELASALERARAAGIADGSVALDPGIGFAKTAEHNLELLARLGELARLGRPLLLGPSRKSFIGRVLGGVPAEERGPGTAAACVVGLLHGARIFRVHDVRMVRQALDVAEAVRRAAPVPAAP
ncbi:MAG TPA: dihydropteroate synthase, partial [Longimicrobiaceae bacterium]|nr:dihydropteroate synthase [Longimicrobiaceae bacterium]